MKTILTHIIVACALAVSAAGFAATEITLVKANPDAKIAYTNPVWSPNGRSIAYVAIPYTESPNEVTFPKAGKSVCLATITGSGWKSRTLVKEADWPVWSPDGKRLAFNQGGLAVMDIATGKITRLTKDQPDPCIANPHVDYPMSWSPNGLYIFYGSITGEGISAFMRNVKVNQNSRLKVGTESAWMADGKLLTTVPGDSSAQFQIIDPATGKIQKLADGLVARQPFNLKGTSYAWVRITENAPKGEGIYRVDFKTKVLTKQIGVRAEEFYWAPSGKQFAFIGKFAMRKGEETQAYLYLGDTRNWVFKILAKGIATPTGSLPDRTRYASWSPASNSIAFATKEGDIKIVKL